MAEHDSTGSAVDRLTYLLIGAGIGATVALLFAPKSGRELRGEIADASHKGLDMTKENARRIGERATNAYGQAAQKAQDIVAVGRETIAAKREQLQHAIDAGKEAYVEEKQRAGAGGQVGEGGGTKTLGTGGGEPKATTGNA